MSSNPNYRRMVADAKAKNHDADMTNHATIMQASKQASKNRKQEKKDDRSFSENLAEKEEVPEGVLSEPSPSPKGKPVRPRFARPSVEEVKAYCRQRGNQIDPQAFADFYESKGWLVGKTPMKSWQACVRTWEGRDALKPNGALALRSDAWTADDIEIHRQEEAEAIETDPEAFERARIGMLAGTALGKRLAL